LTDRYWRGTPAAAVDFAEVVKRALIVLVLVALALPAAASAAAGTVDPSFGSGGETAVPVAGGAMLVDVAQQPDGRLVVASQAPLALEQMIAPDHGVLARVDRDGALDRRFGQNGLAVTPLWMSGMAIAPDGGILVVGGSRQGGNSTFVARFTRDGAPDPLFGNGGTTTLPIQGRAIAVDGAGRVVIGGYMSGSAFAVTRLLPNGQPDPSFDGDGTAAADGGNFARAVAVQPDGGVLVAGSFSGSSSPGYFGGDWGVMRWNSDGSLDTGFGDGGRKRIHFDDGIFADSPSRVAMGPNGTIVIGGDYNRNSGGKVFAAARLLPSGELDPAFGNGGKATLPIEGPIAVGSVAVQPDGKTLIGGEYMPPPPDFPVADDYPYKGLGLAFGRLRADGTPDPDFGNGGAVVTVNSPGIQSINGIVVQASGRIVAGGTAQHCGAAAPTVMRYFGDPSDSAPAAATPVNSCAVPPVVNRTVTLPLDCPIVTTFCHGAVSIIARRKQQARAKFNLNGGQSGSAAVKVPRKLGHQLMKKGRLRVTARFVTRSPNGARHEARRRITLRRPSKTR
jgi:uncharacterized delta-60 repeat protein